jgi:transcriptional regulator with XRE-family HTH domain
MTSQRDDILRSKMLGAMLRLKRKEQGKSLKETAALIGSTTGKLSAYERGKKNISLPELELFAYQFGIPLKYFLRLDTQTEVRKPIPEADLMISLRQKMIGAQLRSHRTEADISLRKFAKTLNIPPSRLSAYERGTRAIPIQELETMVEALGHEIEEYIDHDGPVGEWQQQLQAIEMLSKLSPELRDFLSKPVNEPYLRIAKQLSELKAEKLRTVAEGLLEITL